MKILIKTVKMSVLLALIALPILYIFKYSLDSGFIESRGDKINQRADQQREIPLLNEQVIAQIQERNEKDNKLSWILGSISLIGIFSGFYFSGRKKTKKEE